MLPSEEIKQKINIADLIGEYVPLKKAGVNFKANCPFHKEKTASFIVSPAKQIWHCFGCGLGGDIFEFTKQIEGVEFGEALQMLASRAGVVLHRVDSGTYQARKEEREQLYELNRLATIYYEKVLEKSSQAQIARDYLRNRGLKPETIRSWQIGYSPDEFHAFENIVTAKGFQKSEAVKAGLLIQKDSGFFDRFHGRVMFPLHDVHGRVVGFTGRILVEKEGVGKYVNSPETLIYNKSELLYGLCQARNEIRKQNQAIIVEGNVDVITCHEFGYANAVGSSGTALTDGQLGLLNRFTNRLIFAFDMDDAGVKASRKAVESALKLGFEVYIAKFDREQGKDPDELIRKNLRAWEKAISEKIYFLDFYFEKVCGIINQNSSTDKKQAVAELLPLIALLPDPIERSHYVRKMSDRIGIDEKIILDQVNKHFAKTKEKFNKSEPKTAGNAKRKSRQELIENRSLGFLLKFGSRLLSEWNQLPDEIFTLADLKTIFLTTKAKIRETGSFPDDQHFAPNLKAEAELLQFGIENELSELGTWDFDQVKREIIGELLKENRKRGMKTLAERIKNAERSGNQEEARRISAEFIKLSQGESNGDKGQEKN